MQQNSTLNNTPNETGVPVFLKSVKTETGVPVFLKSVKNLFD